MKKVKFRNEKVLTVEMKNESFRSIISYLGSPFSGNYQIEWNPEERTSFRQSGYPMSSKESNLFFPNNKTYY